VFIGHKATGNNSIVSYRNWKQFHCELSQLQYKKEGNKYIVSMSQKQITDLIKEVHDYNLTSTSVSPYPF
jgi:hypothetical protein